MEGVAANPGGHAGRENRDPACAPWFTETEHMTLGSGIDPADGWRDGTATMCLAASHQRRRGVSASPTSTPATARTFRAMATVGPYSALLNRLTYSQVTCTSGRLTESAVGGKVTVRIALGNNGQDVSNGGVSGRGHFTATGAIADRGSATTYRTVKGSIPGGVITLRIVKVGEKGTITYLVTIHTGPVRRGGQPAPARRHMTAFRHTASSARTPRTPPAPSSGLSSAKQLGGFRTRAHARWL